MFVLAAVNGCSVKAYRGDAKALLAIDLAAAQRANLAGFTIAYTASGETHFVNNEMQFKDPSKHAQDPGHPPTSSINAPLHKFRWTHVPGTPALAAVPFYGTYTYVVTPRYFANGSLLELDATTSVRVDVEVAPFTSGAVTLAVTRGFVQSEAFVHRFGMSTKFRPAGTDVVFDTAAQAGVSPHGVAFTYAQQYAWLGFTARQAVFDLLAEVESDTSTFLDVFAYDLDEPDIVSALVRLAAAGRVRLILDNSSLHHGEADGAPLPEDQVEAAFATQAVTPAGIKRGKFARYAHDKVMIVSRVGAAGVRTPTKVLTGSTNFSITGLYVNSNHLLVFDDESTAQAYATVFNDSWDGGLSAPAFRTTAESMGPTKLGSPQVPKVDITFSPHTDEVAAGVLEIIADRVAAEANALKPSVLFAVMGIQAGTGPVYPALREIHANPAVFSYGISDAPGGIYLYSPHHTTGELVDAKPGPTTLPAPFDQVPHPPDHQVHHKFVVCGFNGADPVVFCGSSNLALGGEEDNGDNLLAIYDADVATAFAIEALGLVDHFAFLDAEESPPDPNAPPPHWYLSVDDKWATPYFDSGDLHCVDRELFA